MRGSWSALGVAVIAAALICAVMVGSFGWTELITSGVRNTLWASLAVVWCIAAIVSAVKLRYDAAKNEMGECENSFGQVVDLYLKGDYYQVEQLLNKLLKENPRDLDASLMLATVLRHTGRFDEESKQLDQLICFDGAEKWELEIQRERELLSEAKYKLKDKQANGMTIAS